MSDFDRRPGSGDAGVEGYEGPGAWGRWALVLLAALFLISAAATVHSILATLGGI